MQMQNHPATACSAAIPNLPAIVVANSLDGAMILDPSRASGTSMAICSGQES